MFQNLYTARLSLGKPLALTPYLLSTAGSQLCRQAQQTHAAGAGKGVRIIAAGKTRARPCPFRARHHLAPGLGHTSSSCSRQNPCPSVPARVRAR